MTDPVEKVAKHVHAVRYAERGRAVGPVVSDEDRAIARDILDDLAYDSLHFLLAARTDRIRDQAAEIKNLRRQLQSVDTEPEGQ